MNSTQGEVIQGFEVYVETDDSGKIWGFEIWRGGKRRYANKPYAISKESALEGARSLLNEICHECGSISARYAELKSRDVNTF
jgi:hypothetical protein